MLKRSLNILLYVAGAAFIVLGSVVLVQIGRGYSYDFKAHRTTRNGLVVFGSTPSGADIQIEHKKPSHRTPYRTTIQAGSYNFMVTKPGFRPWSKRITIRPSTVSWAQYIWLLPNTLKTEAVDNQATITGLVSSRDHRHIAYLATAPTAGVWVLDTTSHQAAKLYTPRAATADRPAEDLLDVSWGDDNSHLLLHSSLGGASNYQVLTLGSPEQTPITDSFKLDLTNLRFSPGNWRELYWNSPEGLRKLDLGAQTVSAVLASNVTSYDYANGRILYVQSTKLGQTLLSMDRSGHDKKELVQSLAESDHYTLAYASYRGQDMLAVLPDKAQTVTLYSDIYSSNPVAKVISKQASRISFNADGRFLTYSGGQNLGTYDLENDEFYNWQTPATLDQISWFDNYHLLVATGGHINLVEFDGANGQTLAAGLGPTGSVVTPDQRAVVLVQSAADGRQRLVMAETKN